MFYIAVGGFSFILGYLRDLADVRNRVVIKKVLGLASISLAIFSTVMLSIRSPLLPLPHFLSLAAWPVFGVFALLFVYSVYIEIQLSQSRQDSKEKRLVTTGTYALSRHPTFLWSVLAMGFLVLATRSQYLLIAWPLWSILELVWVWLQDRFFLPATFAEYDQYRQSTPMLVPTGKSLRRCLTSLRGAVSMEKANRGES